MTYTLTRNSLRTPDNIDYVFAAEEDRCAPRYKVSIPARLRFSGASSFSVEIVNISMAGFACDALLHMHPGTLCWITLPGLTALEAHVVHRDNLGMGCSFQNLLSPAVLDRYIAAYPAKKTTD